MRVLVVAKAPVAGQAKTRLGAVISDPAAARVAAAALADTLVAATTAVGPASCHLALAGDLSAAVDGERLQDLVRGWTVTTQRGGDFAERLVNAHVDAGVGDVVQIGMDTPQVTSALLTQAGAALADHDAALGPADDGGWWVLARRDPAVLGLLGTVRMSTASTYALTWAALAAAGASVATLPGLCDVDTARDAGEVARLAPHTEFARAWAAVGCA
jgi:glycosyltransferase A (GT-A) superfamily protein (DUF2064 family)